MRTQAALCILLLACAAICSSSPLIGCRCVRNLPSVRWANVRHVVMYASRPYCRRQEVIAVMKNNKSRCINPDLEIPATVPRGRDAGVHAARPDSDRSHTAAAASRTTAVPLAEVLL